MTSSRIQEFDVGRWTLDHRIPNNSLNQTKTVLCTVHASQVGRCGVKTFLALALCVDQIFLSRSSARSIGVVKIPIA